MATRTDEHAGAPPACARPKPGLQFADLHAGQVIEAGPYEVSESEILQFAAAYDPQWFHNDTQAASQGHFGGLIASGWHTCAMAMRLAVDAVLGNAQTLASPGSDYIKWSHPVRPGDRLTLRATVLETRTARDRPMLGVLRWQWELFNQLDARVLDMESTVLFDLAKCQPQACQAAA